jgi:protein-disulfide isomerase
VIINFVDTGKVLFLFKDYSINDISPTNSSTLAAKASYCAADQYRYWEDHNELYENWRGENTGLVSRESLPLHTKLRYLIRVQVTNGISRFATVPTFDYMIKNMVS